MSKEMKIYEYVRNYPIAGKKVGDKIKLHTVPLHLKALLKEVSVAPKTETKIQKVYEYIKDYPFAGKKKGDKIKLFAVPAGLKDYVKEVGDKVDDDGDGIPDSTWKKADIIEWLGENGVPDAEGTKEELLELVKSVTE